MKELFADVRTGDDEFALVPGPIQSPATVFLGFGVALLLVWLGMRAAQRYYNGSQPATLRR